MTLPFRLRWLVALAVFALAAVVVGSWGGDQGGAEESRATGPAVSLYVVDHAGADPEPEALAPYEQAFSRIVAGCRIDAEELASLVFQFSDRATMGSGTNMTNLEVIRALARHVGPMGKGAARKDCTEVFARAEARLEGAALG